MNKTKIKNINNVYEILEMTENMGDEIVVRLLDALAIIYYSDNLDIFRIDIVDKYGLIKAEYHTLSCISYKDLSYYVEILCDYYHIDYRLEESIS